MASWVPGKVIANHYWSKGLYSIQVEADVEPFIAGQFTRLALDIDGERVARPYSYVNAPDQQPLEFYFITVPEGPLTERLPDLRCGDEILVQSKAAGFFTLNEIPDADYLWMLSTGTAIGPFISILNTPEPWRRFKKIILVHAVRTASELTYRNTIDRFEQDHPGRFLALSFVSRETSDMALPGRVTDAIKDGSLEQHAGEQITAATAQVMICGNPSMVKDTSEILQIRGLKKNRRREPGHITTENYWKSTD